MLQLKNISKTYRARNGVTHRALNDVSLSFDETGLVFIVGRSGSGKSTLLNIIAALDKPDRGEMSLYGNSFRDFSDSAYDSYRNTYIGVVFQDYNLLPTLTVYQNIALALGLQGTPSDERVDEVLKKLNITEIANRKPNEISGGQSQRVAIARAVIKDPKIILADEPTGNLDSKTGHEMFEIFKELSKEKLVIIVTHDREIADEIGDRVIEIKDGTVHKDLIRTTELYEPAIDTVGDRLVRVPAGKHLDDLALEEINGILARSDRDTYIINEQDTEKVKSMNIHVKNAVDIKQEGNSTYYFPYRAGEEKTEPISLKRSKMPFSTGFKLSLSMLKYKKFRLVITVIMLITALFLSAVAGVFRFYDIDKAAAKTVNREKFEYLLLSKTGTFDMQTRFSDDDVSYLKRSSDKVYPVYLAGAVPEFPEATAEYRTRPKVSDIFESFAGVIELDNGLIYKEGYAAGTDPQNFGEAAISAVVARYLIDYGAFDGKDNADYGALVGKKMIVAGVELKICGVYCSDLKEYEKAKEMSDEYSVSLDDLKNNSETYYYAQLCERDGFMFVKNGFISDMIDNNSAQPVDVTALDETAKLPASYVSKKVEGLDIIYKTGADGVLIDSNLYQSMFDGDPHDENSVKANIASFNETVGDYMFRHVSDQAGGGNINSFIINDLKIAGVVEGESGTVFVGEQDYFKFVEDVLPVNSVLVGTPGSVHKIQKLIKDIGNIDAFISMSFYNDYNRYTKMLGILSQLLTRMTVMFSAVAAVLLFLFISSSVKLESRNVGILRGMGARGIDTFKAFGIEGALITSASLLITVLLILILFPLLNAAMSSNHLFAFYSILINPGAIVFMAVIAVIITAAAVIIPLIRLVRMTPVDAMNKNETQR